MIRGFLEVLPLTVLAVLKAQIRHIAVMTQLATQANLPMEVIAISFAATIKIQEPQKNPVEERSVLEQLATAILENLVLIL